jgi:hypothetical protein
MPRGCDFALEIVLSVPGFSAIPRAAHCFDLMTKADIKAAIERTERQIMALERQHPEQEMRPWCATDHPLALAHWGLVQRRFWLKEQLKKPVYTAAERQARSQRILNRCRPVDNVSSSTL